MKQVAAGRSFIGIGCGAVIVNSNNEVLLLKRVADSRISPGLWTRPGGSVEFGETIIEALKREVYEEIGITVEPTIFLEYKENISDESHWISLGYVAEYVSGNIENKEPTKHDAVRWFDLNELPTELIDQTTLSSIEKYLDMK